MNFRKFGNTDLMVSEVGFGAWGIGGAAMAGNVAIGWGETNPDTSVAAIHKSLDLGVNFFDTADFYGFGKSEELLGRELKNNKEAIIATKVGHRLDKDENIYVDYSGKYIREAVEGSLKRLNRDTIDYYQLHTARIPHLLQGECIETMESLKKEGKIRYWGLSVNTFYPNEEAFYLMEKGLASGFQVVFNVINQRALDLIKKAGESGYGIIARMPLQFGLLTGKFDENSTFEKDDHRSFRLTNEILTQSLRGLGEVWPLTEKYGINKTSLALSHILSYPEVSTVIPGIKTPEQAIANTTDIIQLDKADLKMIEGLYEKRFDPVVELMLKAG
ncbi:MAG: aldo/keto reductase [Cyclobacteriaceae bacterium]|nr:aldo/keto reductase [Cyclobacteriaceae bacterium]